MSTDTSERLTESEAKEKAIENFHEWNNVTGVVSENTGWYYELESILEDAVEFGMKANGNSKS